MIASEVNKCSSVQLRKDPPKFTCDWSSEVNNVNNCSLCTGRHISSWTFQRLSLQAGPVEVALYDSSGFVFGIDVNTPGSAVNWSLDIRVYDKALLNLSISAARPAEHRCRA